MILTNEEGNALTSTAAGKPEDWPEEIHTSVYFTKVGNQTKLSLHQTVNEKKAKQTGAYQSWIKMFIRLSAELAKQ